MARERVTAGGWVLGGILAASCGAAAWGQTPAVSPCAAPKAPKAVETGCPVGPAVPSAAKQFPYPGEGTAGEGEDVPAAPAPAAASPSGGASMPDAAKGVKDQFPYPGEGKDAADGVPEGPDAAASGGPVGKGADAAGGSSSSSAGDASPDVDGKPGLKDEGTEGSTTATRRRRLRPPAQKTLSDDERVEEDLTVAHFYQQSGNLHGAYMRAKDAVKLEPNAAEAHLALAGVAERMGKREEAVAEYTTYLKLDPDGDGVKGARRALAKLQP